MSRKTYVITEGRSDQMLLRELLGARVSDTDLRIEAAGGWSSADSLARSILMRGTEDVALVVDADSSNPDGIQERRQFLKNSLAAIASPRKHQVIVIAPEIDVLLFQDLHILEAIVGYRVKEADLQRGKFQPNQVLTDLLHGKALAEVFKQKLPAINLEPLLQHPDIQSLVQFLQPKRQRAAA